MTLSCNATSKHYSRTPHGVRGLKYMGVHVAVRFTKSHPSRGAWIEIDRGVLRYGLV